MTALRWEPTHVTKHTSRDIPLQDPKRRLWQREIMLEWSMTLMNDLGFNLCVVLWSLVMKWSCILELREVVRKRSLGSKIGMEWTGIGLGPVDINLQTKELHYNYTVLIGSPE